MNSCQIITGTALQHDWLKERTRRRKTCRKFWAKSDQEDLGWLCTPWWPSAECSFLSRGETNAIFIVIGINILVIVCVIFIFIIVCVVTVSVITINIIIASRQPGNHFSTMTDEYCSFTIASVSLSFVEFMEKSCRWKKSKRLGKKFEGRASSLEGISIIATVIIIATTINV